MFVDSRYVQNFLIQTDKWNWEINECLFILRIFVECLSCSVLVTEDEAMNRKDRFSVFIMVLAGRRKIFLNYSDKTYKESGAGYGLKRKDEHLILRECDFRDTEYKLQ